jgi:hypothetical protein
MVLASRGKVIGGIEDADEDRVRPMMPATLGGE